MNSILVTFNYPNQALDDVMISYMVDALINDDTRNNIYQYITIMYEKMGYQCGDTDMLLNKLITACKKTKKSFTNDFIEYIYAVGILHKPENLINTLTE
jgi:hypothetical protein